MQIEGVWGGKHSVVLMGEKNESEIDLESRMLAGLPLLGADSEDEKGREVTSEA